MNIKMQEKNRKKKLKNKKNLDEIDKDLLQLEQKNKRLGIKMIPTPNKENNEENNNNDNNENNNNEENITTNEKNKDIKRCEDGSYENIIGNEEITTNNNNIYNNREANGREIFDAKDLSNINPMNAMNEISVDVPFGENEEKKKKPEFLDDYLYDKIKKNDKGV